MFITNFDYIYRGFDVVIGNPPYLVTKKSDFPNYKWNTDLYKMFFELSINKLSKKTSLILFITPRFFLVNKDDENIRKRLLNDFDIKSLSMCIPFKSAVTENVITILYVDKGNSDIIPVYNYDNISQAFTEIEPVYIPYTKTNKLYEIVIGISLDIIKTLVKIRANSIPFDEVIVSKRGAEISKDFARKNNKGIKVLIGKDIKKYSISWNNTYIPTNHKEYKRLNKFFIKNLIYLRRVDSCLEATISDIERYAFTKNIYGILVKEKYNIYFVLGWLNSKATNFYYKKCFSMKKEEVFPEIQSYLYEQLPFPNINFDNQIQKLKYDKVIELVKQILNIKKQINITMDEQEKQELENKTNTIDNKIDKIIYEFYDLTQEEITVIEGKL